MYLGTQYTEFGQEFLGYLPNITGYLSGISAKSFYNRPSASGSFIINSYGNNQFAGGGGVANNSADVNFKASNSSDTYGRGNLTYNNVIPACVSMKMIIKY